MFRVPVRCPRADPSAAAGISLTIVAALVLAACSGAAPSAPAASSSAAAPLSAAAPSGTEPTRSAGATGGAPVSVDDICAQIPEAAWTALAGAFDATLVKDPEKPCSRSSEEGAVELGVDVEPGRDQIRTLNTACGTVQPVPGIGDEAIWCPSLKSLAIYASGLNQLGDLRDRGIVTPDEFEAKKTELLART